MIKAAAIIALLSLAACGADGAPFVPSANIGAQIGPAGITPQASGVITNGTVSLGVTL